MRLRIPLLLLISCTLVPTAEGGWLSRNRDQETPNIVSQALSIAPSDRIEAIGILEDYLGQGSNPQLLATVRVHAGEQRRLSGDLSRARTHFDGSAEGPPREPSRQAAILGLALLDLETSNSGNATATLKLVPEDDVPDTMNADRYRILALHTTGEGSEERVRDYARKALVYGQSDPVVLARVRLDLGPYLPGLEEPPAPVDNLPADQAAFVRARDALERDNPDEAVRVLDALMETFPETELQGEVGWLRRRAETGNKFESRKVGVLLPLTGTYAPAGLQVQEVLQMAALDSGAGIDLLFRDTAGETETALAALEALVLEDGVSVILGPLLRDVALPLAEEAQAAQVPLVTLSQAAGLTEVGSWIFRGMLTPAQQISGLLDHSMGELGLLRYAVMAPDTPNGHDVTEAFTAEVSERGGEVTISVHYDPEASDLRPAAAELGRKDNQARWRELRDLREDAEERGMDPDKVVLPPVVDFEAIFIPDNVQRVPLVASALAYEEFAIGGFKPQRDMIPLPLLGLNSWHDPRIPTLGGRYVRQCYFVDAFSASLPQPEIEAFVSRYSADRGIAPSVLDALVYDTGRIVGVAIRTHPSNREQARDALMGVRLAQPVTGGGEFSETREINRELVVFTIDAEGIKPVIDEPLETPTEEDQSSPPQ